jgi:hypothetical protein
MKSNNTVKIQVSSYEGVSIEIDTTKVSRRNQDNFIKELQPERFKIWETRERHSYFVGGFQVITMPLNNVGYRAFDENDNFIFVNSKLPKATRTKIIQRFIQQKKQSGTH